MKATISILALALLIAACSASFAAPVFTEDIAIDKSDLGSIGRNPYFILEPGFRLILKGGDVELIITVLNETKTVDGVETRIVEERESEAGRLIELSRNYFAISKTSNTVYYFGEAVDMYDANNKVTHGGSWLAGKDGAKAGVQMPGLILLGSRYYQEIAPKVAMDRAEIISMSEKMTVPAGKFTKVLKIQETSAIEKGVEHKYYAAGIGMISDGELKLASYGPAK